MDVIEPTAPPMYPEVPTDIPRDPEDFRLNKANLILAYLNGQTSHYVEVRKKYVRARSILHKVAVATGSLSVAMTGTGIATSLTGPGVVVGVPLAGVGVVCGIVSAVSTGIMKGLSNKISKHDTTIALSKAKVNTIYDLVSKALKDRRIDDTEFALILAEEQKYEKLKHDLRSEGRVIDLSESSRKKIYEEAHRLGMKEARESMRKRLEQ